LLGHDEDPDGALVLVIYADEGSEADALPDLVFDSDTDDDNDDAIAGNRRQYLDARLMTSGHCEDEWYDQLNGLDREAVCLWRLATQPDGCMV
jgi:hypothetical protein